MAAVRDGEFAALHSLLKAPSKEAVRQLCRECFSSQPGDLGPLALRLCPGLAAGPEEAEELGAALHSLTRHVVYRGFTRAEDILALFPENFHQNLKNLLTKILLENISAWRNEAQASQISLPRLVDMDWRVDIKTSSDSIGKIAVPTCLLQLQIQEDVALCGNSPVVSALTVELSKETLDTMLEGLGRIRDQLSAVANK
ncbi:COMM domain-containing protein 9 [Heliangelus exortis]|uniref:COMM domain-containing protein 9 n=1 Tax=Heliangelus exortis TaxID=472823 RepID=UPI003A91005E